MAELNLQGSEWKTNRYFGKNVPSLVPMTAQRNAIIENTVHRNMRRHGVKREDLRDAVDRKEYAAWLEANPQKAD